MESETWIDIVEYAIKYGVSQSSIRRRIKSKSIEYRLHKGKYLLKDSVETLGAAPLFTRFNLRQSESVQDLGIRQIQEENKQLRERIAELEMLVGVLESNGERTQV